jgi:hypothetical protein
MEAERIDTPAVRAPWRSFKRDDVTWVVREAEADRVPGAQGATSLVFDSQQAIRRAWLFPRNWYQLDASALWAVSERSGKISAKLDLKGRYLGPTLAAHFVNISRAEELHARAKAALAENQAQRAERGSLLEACREERNRMREMVEASAGELRTAGLTEEDASLFVASAVRETVVQLGANIDSAVRLERDACRWCANAYRAA